VTEARAISVEAHHQLLHRLRQLLEATIHVSPHGPERAA
jgi:hypothetical protein